MEAITIKINDTNVVVPEGATILEAAQQAKIEIPTLYYLKGINNTDDSGVCVVEVNGAIVPAASTYVEAGMEVQTATPAVMAARKEALKKILAIHNYDCTDCVRIDNCELKPLLHLYDVTNEPSLAESDLVPLDTSFPVLVRDNNKCIRCGRCVAVCGKVQGIAALRTVGVGLEAQVVPMDSAFASGMGLGAVNCINCGQCITACPVGALAEKDNTAEVYAALADPDKYVVVEVAPAVRASLGENFDFPIGVDVEGKIAVALRELGFDKVFDTKFSADLTIMEEANEFLNRMQNGGKLPLLTSCCPGWVKYCEHFYPDMTDHLSSCKSPQQMFGAVAKSYYAEKLGIPKEKIVVVSVMPCTAKKFEITRPEMAGDVDISITTNELARMIKDAEIQMEAMDFEEFDNPLGLGTGAGVIFGATGGVMEAALRTAVEKMGGKALDKLEFCDVRGVEGVKEASYEVNGKTLKVAVASGLANAKIVMDKVRSGEADYQFIEIMACPGGCVNGGGQPHLSYKDSVLTDIRKVRADMLYANDQSSEIRKAHENPAIADLYKDYLGQPGSEKAHDLLHTTYVAR